MRHENHGKQSPTEADQADRAREVYYGPHGLRAGISYLRMRDEWSAWWQERPGEFSNEVVGTREEALDVLRRQGMWEIPAGRA